jgi:hypothetical protein
LAKGLRTGRKNRNPHEKSDLRTKSTASELQRNIVEALHSNDLGELRAPMGGYGSGWQGSKRETVNDSLSLSIAALVRKGALVAGARTSGVWAWTYEGERSPHATIGYEANLVDADAAWLRLHYRANGEPLDYRVQLTTTRPNYGGRRWWFICPLVRQDSGRAHRAAKLHLPPGGRYFGSREAQGLTYTSCQESGKWNGLFRRLAADIGTDQATVRAALREKWI